MLTRFEVKGFKSLADVAVDLGAVNVFIGANGSGKSNLLEAIGFFSAILSGAKDAEAFRYRGIRLGEPKSFLSVTTQLSAVRAVFGAYFDEFSYQLNLQPRTKRIHDWSFCHESVTIDNLLLVEREDKVWTFAPTTEQNVKIPIESSISIVSVIPLLSGLLPTLLKNQFKDGDLAQGIVKLVEKMNLLDLLILPNHFAIYSPSTPQLRGFLDDIQRDPLGLGGSALGKAIEEMLSKDPEKLGPFEMDEVLDLIEWSDHIGTDAPEVGTNSDVPIRLRISDKYMHNKHKTVSALEASEGALYVLFLLALVGHERSPKMFAIDNFDQALHPRLARELTKMICDQIIADGTRQMFATTHNPLVLNGLNLLDDRIRLFTVDRDETGASQIKRVIVSDKLMNKAEAGYPLSELWTSGWLGGGVPKNY